MKNSLIQSIKQLYFVIAILFFLTSDAQINFADSQFKAKLLSSNLTDLWPVALDFNRQPMIVDANNDGEIQAEEALNVFHLTVIGAGIVSLDGIENFTNLQALYCSRNQLEHLDYNLPSLKKLECQENAIRNLNIPNFPQLAFIHCSNNLITTLDLRSITVGTLDCSNNLISEIHFGSQMQHSQLLLRNNLFTNLEIINPGKMIEVIDISNNPLSTFNVEAYSIDNFTCHNTTIPNLDLSKIERESTSGNEFSIANNPLLRTINFRNGTLDFCISGPFTSCVNSFFSLYNNPLLETVCADEGDEMTYLQPLANSLGFTLTTDCTLAVNNSVRLQESSIYPNPANEIINIQSNTEIIQVTILNALGQVVSQTKTSPQSYDLKIDATILKSGTYFVEITSDKGRTVQKLIKQ